MILLVLYLCYNFNFFFYAGLTINKILYFINLLYTTAQHCQLTGPVDFEDACISNKINNILNINGLILSSLTIVPVCYNNSRKSNISSYLAGLIESDGSIIVPGENIKSYKPFFEIVFHLNDLGLAQILQSIIGGNIQIRSENHCRLTIKKKLEVIKIIHLLNVVCGLQK